MISDIFLDERGLGYHHFRTMIALESTLSKEDSAKHIKHISRFEVRNFRRFLKVIFFHLTSTTRTRWGVVVHSSDNFLVCIHIDDI